MGVGIGTHPQWKPGVLIWINRHECSARVKKNPPSSEGLVIGLPINVNSSTARRQHSHISPELRLGRDRCSPYGCTQVLMALDKRSLPTEFRFTEF
jgi:hypothetical protein